MKFLKRILIPGLALLLCSGASAKPNLATAEVLMRASGLWNQLEDIAPAIRAELSSSLSRTEPAMAPVEIERICAISDDLYSGTRLRAAVQAFIAKEINKTIAGKLMAWYQSPTGRAMTLLEVEASSRQRDPSAALEEGRDLLATLPAARQKQLSRLVDVTNIVEALTNITINTAIASSVGASSTLPQEQRRSVSEFRRKMNEQRPAMLKSIRDISLASFASAYAKASDADLNKYIEFLQTTSGKHFSDVGIRAVDLALTEAATKLGRNIGTARNHSRV